MKKTLPKLVTSLIIISTFLWSQCIWAYGFSLYAAPSTEKKLPNNIQEKSLKESRISDIISQITIPENFINLTPDISPSPTVKECTEEINLDQFLAFLTPQIPPQIYPLGGQTDRLGRVDQKYGTYDGKAYKWQALSYDDLGRPTAYKEKHGKVNSRHYDIQYNELGDVAYEKVRVTSKSGTGIFSSKSKVLTEYKYGYDEYGQYEKTWENEIYRKVSTNPIGTIVKAIVSIIIIAATWGMATPVVAAWMALSNFVFALLSGASLKDALIGAAISFAAAVIGAQLGATFGGGVSTATSTATGFAGFLKEGGMTMLFQALSLADSLMVDDQGRGLFEQMFGKWGSVVFDVISVLVAFKTSTGNKGPPYQLYAAIGRLAVSTALTALGDKIDPRLRQFISAFTTSFLNAWANAKTEQARETTLKEQGFQKTTEGDWVKWEGNRQIRITKEGKLITDVFNNEGKYQYTEVLLKNGTIAVTDLFGNVQKYLTPQLGGSYAVYSNIGEFEGILQPGARLWIGSTGLFNGSILEADDGKLMIFDWTGTQALERDSIGNLTTYDNFGTKEGYLSINENIYYQYDRDQNLRQITNYNTGNDFFYDPDGTITKIVTPNGLIQDTVGDLIHKWSFAEGKKLNAIPIYNENGEMLGVFGTYVNNNEIRGFLMDDKVNNLYRSFDLSGDETQSIPKDEFNNYVDTTKDVTTNLVDIGKTLFIGGIKDILNEYNLLLKGGTVFDMRGGNIAGEIIGAIPMQPSLGSILANILTTTDNYLESLRFKNAAYYDQIMLKYDSTTQTPEQVIQFAQDKFGEFKVVGYKVHENMGLIEVITKTPLERFKSSLQDLIHIYIARGIEPAQIGVTIGPGAKKGFNIFGLKGEAGYFAGQEYGLGGEDFLRGETKITAGITFGFSDEKIKVGPEFGISLDNINGVPLTGEFTPYGELDLGTKQFDFLQIEKQMGKPFQFEPVLVTSEHFGYLGYKLKIEPVKVWDNVKWLFSSNPSSDDIIYLRRYWNFRRSVADWWERLWRND